MKLFLLLALVLGAHICRAQNVLQAEYFIDTDKGFGKNTIVSVTASPDGNFPFRAQLSNLSRGNHTLYIRTKDSGGEWSATTHQNIEVLGSNATAKITGGEYFIDTDPGFGKANQLTISPSDSVILQNLLVTVGSLSAGYHKLYLRLKDSNGEWSQTTGRSAEIIKPVSAISGAEYFFKTDSGFGKANAIKFDLRGTDSSFAFKIPFSNIPAGAHTLYIRAKDSLSNNWSLTQSQSDSVVTSSGQDSLWSHPASWSNNKVPDRNTVVLLYHKIYVDIPTAICKSLTPYRNDAKCIVSTNMKLTITGHPN